MKLIRIMMNFRILLNLLLIPLSIDAQIFDIEKDFDQVKAFSDTIYLVKDEIFEENYLIFNDKESLLAHFEFQNSGKTGKFENDYLISIQYIESFYISKNEVNEVDYQHFRDSIRKNSSEKLTLSDMEAYCKYLSNLWDIPVRLPNISEWTNENEFRLVITQSDWEHKKAINNLNLYMSKAYGKSTPINFRFEGIDYLGKLIKWIEVTGMQIDRQQKFLIINTKNEIIKLPYKDEQYSDLASVHVNFLAFLDMLKRKS